MCSPTCVMVAAAAALVAAKVITIENALVGFSNTSVITIAAILIISEAIKETKILDILTLALLPKSYST